MQYDVGYQYKLNGCLACAGATRAETLDPSPQLEIELEHGFPESFPGKLINAAPKLISVLRFGDDVCATFQGKRYRFARLDSDGTFELLADGWS